MLCLFASLLGASSSAISFLDGSTFFGKNKNNSIWLIFIVDRVGSYQRLSERIFSKGFIFKNR